MHSTGRKIFLLLLLVAILCLPALSGHSSTGTTGKLNLGTSSFPVNPLPFSSWYLDTTGNKTINQVLSDPGISFTATTDEILDLGITNSPVWVKIPVQGIPPATLLLEFDSHKFWNITLYFVDDNNTIIHSINYDYHKAFSTRKINSYHLTLPMEQQILAKTSKLVFRVTSKNKLILPLLIHSKESFNQKQQVMYTIWAVYYGILIVMFIYNLFILVYLWDRNYLYYVIYIVFYTVYLSALSGIGAQYLWPELSGRWVTVFSALFGGLSLAAGVQLSREFLQTKIRNPWVDKYLLVLMAAGGALSFINFLFEDFTIAYIYGNLVGTIIVLSFFGVSIISLVKGYRPALLYLVSHSMVLLGQAIYSVTSLGVFEDNIFLTNINQFAPVAQVVLLSLALAYRFNVMRIEKEEMKAVAFKINEELAIAEKVQKKVLTTSRQYRNIKNVDIDVYYSPMLKNVGGDYYNIMKDSTGKVSFFIADATGHGIQAALATMQIDILYRQGVEYTTPADRLAFMNKRILEDTDNDNLFTAFMATFDNGRLRFSSAGHPDQLLYRKKTGDMVNLNTRGPIIGFMENFKIGTSEVSVEPGDILFIFTDGLLEGIELNQPNVFTDMKDRIKSTLAFCGPSTPMKNIISDIITSVGHSSPLKEQQDDITLMGIRFIK